MPKPGPFSFAPNGGEQVQSTQVLIDLGSLNSNHAERDRHLLSHDFLDAPPEASFTSTSFSGDTSGGTLTGDLTLHGVTRPTQLTVRLIGEGDDPWGGYRAGFEGTTASRRTTTGSTTAPSTWSTSASSSRGSGADDPGADRAVVLRGNASRHGPVARAFHWASTALGAWMTELDYYDR